MLTRRTSRPRETCYRNVRSPAFETHSVPHWMRETDPMLTVPHGHGTLPPRKEDLGRGSEGDASLGVQGRQYIVWYMPPGTEFRLRSAPAADHPGSSRQLGFSQRVDSRPHGQTVPLPSGAGVPASS